MKFGKPVVSGKVKNHKNSKHGKFKTIKNKKKIKKNKKLIQVGLVHTLPPATRYLYSYAKHGIGSSSSTATIPFSVFIIFHFTPVFFN